MTTLDSVHHSYIGHSVAIDNWLETPVYLYSLAKSCQDFSEYYLLSEEWNPVWKTLRLIVVFYMFGSFPWLPGTTMLQGGWDPYQCHCGYCWLF